MLAPRKVAATFIGITTLASVIVASQPAEAARNGGASACPPLPKVAWWKTSHAKIVKYVDKKYNGEWEPYIDKWINYQSKMQKIYDRDGTATVKSRDLRLKGETLAKHIGEIGQRIAVTQCLKSKYAGRMAANGLTNGTAKGGAENDIIAKAGKEVRVAEVSEGRLDLEINARCDGRTPIFQITNLGDKWPRLAAISLYRTNGKAMVTKRRMKMDSSQQATFKMRKRGKALKGEIGMFIQPSWTKRGFKYDSKIRCS